MVLSKREFIKDIILEQQHNNKIAIEDEKEHITYRELHNTCTKISETIQRESDCKNNRNVGIFLNNSVDYAKAYFSIAYMDRTIIPVEVTLSKEQIVSILDYCEISTIITNKKYYEQLTNSLQDYEYFMEIFCIEENKLYQFEGKSRLLSESMESGVSVQDTAIMLHTSGTTSNPKRLMLTHNNLITNVKSNIKSLKLNEEDKSLIVLPMYFGYCNSSQFLTHMYLGASVVIAPQPFNPARFLSFIEKYSITNTTCIPSMLFLTIAMKKKYDLQNIVKTIYVNDINVKKIYNSNCIVLENNVFDLNISDYKINKVFLGHAFEHFWGESDIKFIEKVGNELPIGGKCCIEPLFIGQKYIEVIREGFLHDKQDDNPIRIITKTSMFPGKVEENMGFARIYDIQSFERRIKQIAKKCGLKITIYSFKSNDKYLPDMIKYKFKRKEINYPYRMLILEKEK